MNYYLKEKSVISGIKGLLLKFDQEFQIFGITNSIAITRSSLTENSYTSEIEIVFFRNKDYFDIIEFFIFLNGDYIFNEHDGFLEVEQDILDVLNKTE